MIRKIIFNDALLSGGMGPISMANMAKSYENGTKFLACRGMSFADFFFFFFFFFFIFFLFQNGWQIVLIVRVATHRTWPGSNLFTKLISRQVSTAMLHSCRLAFGLNHHLVNSVKVVCGCKNRQARLSHP